MTRAEAIQDLEAIEACRNALNRLEARIREDMPKLQPVTNPSKDNGSQKRLKNS